MRYHLDPIGGVAGDMLIAALLGCHPEWWPELEKDFAAAGFDPGLCIEFVPHHDDVLSGYRFSVHLPNPLQPGHHRQWCELRQTLQQSRLDVAVMRRAVAIFELLAEAEAAVHGKSPEEVEFHEVGAWDSIADVVCAAWLIERTGTASWTCGPLPLGRGRVHSAHGDLPVPAPAVSRLLMGFPVFEDAHEGERVTPTGAAVLKHLEPSFVPTAAPMRLLGEGYGFGTRRFEGLSNVLRVLRLAPAEGAAGDGQVLVCQFEVDDQSPEDLAVGLDKLRGHDAVLDVTQTAVHGKKGRLAIQVQLLGEPHALDKIIERCFVETTTLGVRWQVVNRRVLPRHSTVHPVEGETVQVKRAERPGVGVTTKAEMTDLAAAPDGHAGRERRRRLAESAVSDATREVEDW